MAQLYASDGDLSLYQQSLQEAERYLLQMKNGIENIPLSGVSIIPDLNEGFGV